MVRVCKVCSKKIGLFEVTEVSPEGNIVCKACSDKMKAEQEQAQKQKQDEDYRVNLAKALAKNSQWEYKILNAGLGSENEQQLNKLGAEGWQLVSLVSQGGNSAPPPQPIQVQNQPSTNPSQPPQQQMQQPQTQQAPAVIAYVFKRKL